MRKLGWAVAWVGLVSFTGGCLPCLCYSPPPESNKAVDHKTSNKDKGRKRDDGSSYREGGSGEKKTESSSSGDKDKGSSRSDKKDEKKDPKKTGEDPKGDVRKKDD